MNLKGILVSTFSFVFSVLFALLLVKLMSRKKEWSKPAKVRRFIAFFLIFYVFGALAYFGRYARPTEEALKYMENDNTVTVTKEGNTYFFDGPGEDAALVFYPGAKVAAVAYAHLLHDIAARGVDAFVVEMPLHMAFLGRNNAAGIIQKYDYDTWYVGGHSLGGAMAGEFTATHGDMVDGLYLLGAYSAAPLQDRVKVVLVYGSNDTVMRMDEYQAGKANLPDDAIEVIIEGGNHAQFGDYGEQARDSEASIDANDQIAQAVDAFYLMVDQGE